MRYLATRLKARTRSENFQEKQTARKGAWLAVLALALAMLATSTHALAQTLGAPPAPVKYDNRYEVYGGLNMMTFYAGRYLPKRMINGGWEGLGTYWLTHRVGLSLDGRGEYGTTPVLPAAGNVNRPLVYQHMLMAGAQVRGPRNQNFALSYHGYYGVSKGTFDKGTGGLPPQNFGLYTNRTKPVAALGIALDINRSARWAVRFSPEMVMTHFGDEWVDNLSISGGVLYRFGKH
jgi:hypothetical protein